MCCEGAYPPGILGVCVCLSSERGTVGAVSAPHSEYVLSVGFLLLVIL